MLEKRYPDPKHPFQTRADNGELIGPFNSFLRVPDIAKAFLTMHGVEERNTPLSKRVRKVVMLSVGAVWKAEYELYAHSATAVESGFSPKTIQELASAKLSQDLSAEEQIAQLFTLEIAEKRRVGSELYESARQAFGEAGIVAMTMLAGMYMTTCALLNVAEVPRPELD